MHKTLTSQITFTNNVHALEAVRGHPQPGATSLPSRAFHSLSRTHFSLSRSAANKRSNSLRTSPSSTQAPETTATATATADLLESLEAAPELQGDKDFQWGKQWYSIGFSKYIDTSKPYAFQLLSKRLVLWQDSSATWRCFEDKCAHRAAPLSEGKIWPEEDTLMCSYHGWKYQTDGGCVRVPQAASEAAEKNACASARSCVKTHPVAEAQGMLFVWGSAGPSAIKDAEATPVPVCPLTEAALRTEDEEITYVMPPYQRDLPYDVSTLIENVLDPAHVPFSHHGVQGNRSRVKYGDYELVPEKMENKLGVAYRGPFGPGHITFQPPGIVNYTSKTPDGIFSSFRIYCTPTSPGNCRIISFLTTNRKKLPFIFALTKKLPSWVDHLVFRHPVLDGDNVFLHYQEHYVIDQERENGKGWRSLFFMPTKADTLVAMFRNWVDTVGKGGPYGPLHKARGYPALITDHRVLLNRFEQHTKNCKACSGALVWVARARAVAGALSALGFGAAMAAWMHAMQAGGGAAVGSAARSIAGGALVGMVFALVWRWLCKTRDAFFYVDYLHSER